MISGVNIVALNSRGGCLMTYLADNYNAEEYYGKSEDVYVAIQTLNLKNPIPESYQIAAKKGMIIGGACITTLPYNPIIEGVKGNYVLIFESSLGTHARGLICRNINVSKRNVKMADSLSYLKVLYKDKTYDLNVDTYAMLLKENGFDVATPRCFVVDVNPRKDSSGLWHMAIGCAPDNFILIVKSKDLHLWHYENVIPLKGNETDILYNDNSYCYLIRAGNKVFFGKKDVSPYVIENSVASRPRMFVENGNVYLMYNSVDKDYLSERSMMSLCRLNTEDDSLVEVMRFQRKETIQYYDIIGYKNNIYELFSTDSTNKYRYSKGELQIIKIL